MDIEGLLKLDEIDE